MVQVSYPGVYVQEVPSGVRTIAAVSTSVTAFVGRTFFGPFGGGTAGDQPQPQLVTSFADFERTFGTLEQNAAFGEMGEQVKQFFLNGGQLAWVTRILGNNAQIADVITQNSADGLATATAATFTALSAGTWANGTEVTVRYAGGNANDRFALSIDLDGAVETYTDLSLDPDSNRFATTILAEGSASEGASTLIGITGVGASAAGGLSQSAVFIPADPGDFTTFWDTAISAAGAEALFRISLDGGQSFVSVDISNIDTANETTVSDDIADAINNQTPSAAPVVSVAFGSAAGFDHLLLEFTAAADLVLGPAPANDIGVALGLGNSLGGFEAGRFAHARPQATGTLIGGALSSATYAASLVAQGAVTQTDWDASTLTVDGTTIDLSDHSLSDDVVNTGLGALFDAIAAAVNGHAALNPTFAWGAERNGLRTRVFRSRNDGFNNLATVAFGGPIAALFSGITALQQYFVVGDTSTPPFVEPSQDGSDGDAPLPSAYDDAYLAIERDVDIMNLLVLPRDSGDMGGAQQQALWGRASVFCQEQRAFLLVDPPDGWDSAQDVISGGSSVSNLRIGMVTDHAAVYFPKVCVSQDVGADLKLGPSGTIAGLMARTDANRGVWKAPAGTEADLRGTTGLEFNLSDRENGVINPRGVNALRVFPNGLVSWGARTLDGDDDFGSEWKYVPVRRTALFIEESLFRGLRFAVFEPNDEPLWSQIRLNVGAFMNNLFRQGAFQGKTSREAYFVKCDADTTTQNDINLGIVNVLVGFAPLKPAEFVVLRIQQLAGQVQT